MQDSHLAGEKHSNLRRSPWPWIAIAVVLTLAIVQLHFQGRHAWCTCDRLCLWTGDVWSSHCSQHLFDPYSLTHVLHGLLLYGILTLTAPKLRLSWRLFLAVALEAGWEVFENCDFTIGRYRAMTMALNYQGDSIVNSLGDIASCVIGFLLARRLGLWGSLGIFVSVECLLAIWIHDGLLLNILMLTWPIDAIKTWQMGH